MAKEKITKLPKKNNQSSLQVLKTFQTLLQNDYTMQELIAVLNKNENNNIFNNSVLSKYINTCRFVGIDIQKVNGKYYISNIPFGLNMNVNDIDLMQNLQVIVKNEMSAKCGKIFDKFIEKLNRYSNKKIARVEKSDFKLSFELFERAVLNKRKIKLIFKNRDVLECIPLKISEANGKKFFNVFNKRIRAIDSSRLTAVQLTENKFIEPFDGGQVTIFKITGPLLKRYTLHENETIELDKDGKEGIVTNRYENKEMLFSRLLRYENYCEILMPKVYREEFRQLVENTLKLYGID